MATPIVLPEGYRYVAAALVSTTWLLGWQTSIVSRHRKKAGIKYPQLYAEKAETQASQAAHVFNCAQRAHQSTLEHMPIVLVATVVSAARYPVFAASMCVFWVFARVLYTIGYTTGDVDKRNNWGGIIPFLGLVFGSTYVAFQLLVGV